MEHYIDDKGRFIIESDKGNLYHLICSSERKCFVDYEIDENGDITVGIGEPYDETEDYYEYYVCITQTGGAAASSEDFSQYIGVPFTSWDIKTAEQMIREYEDKENKEN